MNGKHKYELCSGLIFLIQYWNTILLRVFALMNEKKNMYDIHTVCIQSILIRPSQSCLLVERKNYYYKNGSG